MIAIEIIMLIIGIAAVIASFRLSDEKETDNTKSNIDAEELEEKIKDAVKETEDYIITKADEKFSQISNDKIMGFNEYSKEVFDKIEKNHEETVFLYNMLTEKEKEIQKKSLQKQLEEISLQSNELMTFVEAMPKWNEIFSQADLQTKQMILSTLIDKIIVKDDDITIKFKIRLDNFLDEKLLENDGLDVPQQRLQLYDHVLHGI